MVRIVQRGNVRIYVYRERGHRHHAPHCHVYWPGGACAVDLEHERVIAGPDPPTAAWELLREHLDALRLAWVRLNQESLT